VRAIAAAGVAVAALAAGAAMWWAGRPQPLVSPPAISGAALYATAFRDLDGKPQPLGQFQGRVLVLNYWATWCAPCREEMPAFERASRRWRDRGVAFVGVSQEAPEVVGRFAREIGVAYPLWIAGDEAGALARRLGNRVDGLPFTAIIGPDGSVRAAKVGPYTEAQLNEALASISANSP
jgi:thiol-disulfide isomerase/thioredoxin